MSSFAYLMSHEATRRGAPARQIMCDYQYGAAQHLAAVERYRAWIAHVEQTRLLREAGVSPRGTGARPVMIRVAIGTVLVRLGEWLLSGSAGGAASEPIPSR
jgi:hypothetical protein